MNIMNVSFTFSFDDDNTQFDTAYVAEALMDLQLLLEGGSVKVEHVWSGEVTELDLTDAGVK